MWEPLPFSYLSPSSGWGGGVSGGGSACERLFRGDTQLTGWEVVFVLLKPGILIQFTSWHCTWCSAVPGFRVLRHWDRQGRTVPFTPAF